MEKLDEYINSIHEERPGLLKKVQHSEQLGLTQARLSGWKIAVGDVVAILDAHIEVHVQWLVEMQSGQSYCSLVLNIDLVLYLLSHLLKYHCVCRAEPLLARIKENRTVILTPVFDKVNYDDLTLTPYGPNADGFDWALWCMYESFRPEWYALEDDSQPGR